MELVNQTMVGMVVVLLLVPLILFLGKLFIRRSSLNNPTNPPKKLLWQELDPSIAELLQQQQTAKHDPQYALTLLTKMIGRRDRVTGELFQPGEEIYVCFRCELGYHQDSWDFLEQQCEQCGAISPKIQKLLLPEVSP